MSPAKRHIVRLYKEEERVLEEISQDRGHSARVTRRARALQMSHAGKKDKEIAEALGLSISTIPRIRKRYEEGGLNQALFDAERPGGPKKFTAQEESALFALVCSNPPDQRPAWTLRLIKETAEREKIVESISVRKIQLLLKKWGVSKPRGSSITASPSD